MKICRNMARIDQLVRLMTGVALIYIGFIDKEFIESAFISWAVGLFGVVNLFSAMMLFCPVYWIAGISTYQAPEEDKDEKEDDASAVIKR